MSKNTEGMKLTDPAIQLLTITDGSLRGVFAATGTKRHGFIDSAEGVRVPFNRKKAARRAKKMREQAHAA